jgi:hypothetical protein
VVTFYRELGNPQVGRVFGIHYTESWVVPKSIETVVTFYRELGSPQIGRDFGNLYTGSWVIPKSVETLVLFIEGAGWVPEAQSS